jgi:group I intron endonuclease
MAFIYTLSHPITGEIRYIGKTCQISLEKRLNEHIYECSRSRRKSTNWTQSLLKQNLRPKIEALEECSCEEAISIESYWIYQFTAWGFNLLNHSFGGEGGYRQETEEQKKSRSERVRGNKNPFFGKTHSEETKLKISKAKKGQKMPQSHIDSCKRRMANFKPSQKSIDNMIKKTAKPVLQLDLEGNLIKRWPTINGCGRDGGFLACKIIECCKGRRKTHKGFRWMYEEV